MLQNLKSGSNCWKIRKWLLDNRRLNNNNNCSNLIFGICGLNIILIFIIIGIIIHGYWNCLGGGIAKPLQNPNWNSYITDRNNRNTYLLERYLLQKSSLRISKERQYEMIQEKTQMTDNSTKGIYHYIFDMEKLEMLHTEKTQVDKIYNDWGDSETIFVALCSYRDDQCKNTLIHLFEQAKYPDRIRVGIFQQHNYSDTDCMDFDKLLDCDVLPDEPLHPLCGRFWQIKIDRISYISAKGPMYGRYRAEQFYNGENYILQIDAHSHFVTHWDNIAIDMFKRTNNEYAVFTSYPKATGKDLAKWRPPISKPRASMVAICKTKQLAGNYMFKHDRGHYIDNPGKPALTPFFAAGFSFARGHRLLNVPTDPYLPYLFDGEEILMSIRLWTHGYDLYLPDRDIIYHIYEQYYKRPLFWNDDWNNKKRTAVKSAQNRINYIIQLYDKYPKRGVLDLRDVEKYNLGNQRNISEFWTWINYDFEKKESPEFCDKLKSGGFNRIPTFSELRHP